MSRLLFLLFVLILVLPSLLLAGDDDVTIGERPKWVSAQDWDSSTTTPTLGAGNESVVYLLEDYQHYPQRDAKYTKRVYRVTNDTGVQQQLKVTIDFDPSYSKLILHDISIRRGEETINKCDLSKMKIFQPEDDLSRDIYSEDKRVLVFLDDLRVDDIIVVESTKIGTNPALLGHYSFRLPLRFSVPVERAFYRVLWGTERPLYHRAMHCDIKPKMTQQEDHVEYAWSIPPQPEHRYEGNTPVDFNDRPYIEASSSNDWAAVVDWGLKTYKALDDPLDTDTQKMVDQWKQEFSEPEQRALRALRFVQDKIRYVGLEMGAGGLRPASPTTTMNCRFGDCKAKAILLSAMLRDMDIEASPALVNTYRGNEIENSLPTPFAFNHVIVRAAVSGKTVWVDPTRSQQGGAFSASYIPAYYGKALVINDGVKGLDKVRCPAEAMDNRHTDMIFDVDDYDGTATMKVITAFHGSEADSMRESLIDMNRETLAEDYLEYYADTYPGIRDPADLIITDDRESNVVLIKEQYFVDDLFTQDEEDEPRYVELYPFGLSSVLPSPDTRTRKTPLAIDHPVRRTYKTVLNTPDAIEYSDTFEEVVDPAFKFSTRQSFKGKTSEFEYSIETLRDRVSPDEIAQYLVNLDTVDGLTGDYPEAPNPFANQLNWFAIVVSLSTVVMVGAATFWAGSAKKSDGDEVAEPEYPSIGGWLVLVGFGVTLAALLTPVWFFRDGSSYFTWASWTDLETGLVLTFELICNSVIAVLSIAMAATFFTKRRMFPKLYILFCVCSILYLIGDNALCFSLLDIPMEPEDYSELIKIVVRSAIWCPYMLISKRVKGTFVR